MSLFWKIFLWFLLGIALITGASVFISWTTQREPMQERWRQIIANAMNVYTETAKQIYDNEGKEGVERFLRTVNSTYESRSICLTVDKNRSCFEGDGNNALPAIERAFSRQTLEFEYISPEENYAAQKFTTAKGEDFMLVMRTEFPRPPIPFGRDWATRIFRILVILLIAAFICYIFTRNLLKPILQLGKTTKLFADGDLKVRTNIKRRDEIGQLSRDFDEMAERIESLITSQQNLNRDISHELRSPLARMNVALELAKNSKNNGNFLARIETESQRLNEMISDILTLSKLESNTANVEKTEVNLKSLVETVVSDVAFEAEGKGKSVEILQTDEIKVHGNERLLRSAVENVLRNAVRYTKDKVEVSLQKNGTKAIVTIRDYGEGIPENELKEIFRPFYRVSQARERKSGGIGLGLAITEQAVRAHDGGVSAKNLGDGLSVEIKLPYERP
jgi:two-component system sensor histidine kinase CpxA